MPRNYTMHVVSHTHWDREWYKTFQHFRMRLVNLTDELIKLLESDPEYKVFTFDGQTIVLDDYIQIRPENEERLRKLVKEGRILIGPWYNQPDEFLVSGEGMIRNLMLGYKMGQDWGNWMRIGYVPDAFGHISQFPQIMQGFGIDNAVLFRGITTDQVDSEFTWRGADGTEVFCVKMPDNNAYSNFFYRMRNTLSAEGEIDFEQSRKEIMELISDSETERPATSNLLFMDGVDHIFANPKTPAIMKDVNENLQVGTIKHSTLPAFIEAVKAENPELGVYEGELRWNNRAWKLSGILANVMSSRVHLKQANHEIENLLERWVEPFTAIAWANGKDYPKTYVDLAWKYLLMNHPHDSICGCSIDQVHKDMVYRFDQARLIAEPIVEQSLQYIADNIDTAAALKNVTTAQTNESKGGIAGPLPWEADQSAQSSNAVHTTPVVVFNPLSWERTDIVEAEIGIPHEWNSAGMKVVDEAGNEVPYSVFGPLPKWGLLQKPYDIPMGLPLKYYKVSFYAENIPSVGYKTFFLNVLPTPYRVVGSMLTGINSAENEYLALIVESDGSLTIVDKETEQVYTDCMVFEDGGDFGEGYHYVKPMRDTVVTSLGSPVTTSVIEDNSLRVVFKLDTVLTVPASKHANNQERSAEKVDMKITSYVTLAKGSRRVDIVSNVDNNALDHRIRVLFASGIDTDFSNAESTFDVVKRTVHTPECRDWSTPMPHEHPQRSFVDLNDGEIGLTIINDGLIEYEAKSDAERTIALTLMRCTGNGVGGPEQQTDGQMLGLHQFKYAIYPHAGDWQAADVWQQAWAHNVPFKVAQTGIHEGKLPAANSFMSISDSSVVLSTLKKAENADQIVTRVYNIEEAPASGCQIAISNTGNLYAANLNEEITDNTSAGEGAVTIDVHAKRIITFAGDVKKG
ncbi:MAG: alpha-mannosidase [Armatimonadota bacterium]